MYQSVWAMLNESEKELLRLAEKDSLAAMDEDELSALHDRIRRARSKYNKLYRRRAAEQVQGDGSRKRAHGAHARTLAKAEAFEDALARVSRSLAVAAKKAADELKAERLAAARAAKSGAPARQSGGDGARSKPAGTAKAKAPRKTPASKKASASARASTRRAQAKRSSR
ncbi:MAG TPA: hypothetical protein VK866_04045 [Acidimicrobiales bacterium]|nr:hypothetical protein [Acidimicrobiales bacterium]